MSENVINVSLVVFSSFVALWIYRKQRQKKSLSYSVQGQYNLLSDKIKDTDLQIFYKEKEFKQASILTIQIRNNGTVPIEPSDFMKAIRIIFSEGSDILDVTKGDERPNGLGIEFEFENRTLTINPFLLNG